MSNISVKL